VSVLSFPILLRKGWPSSSRVQETKGGSHLLSSRGMYLIAHFQQLAKLTKLFNISAISPCKFKLIIMRSSFDFKMCMKYRYKPGIVLVFKSHHKCIIQAILFQNFIF
jgi:hypothetical protein